MRPSRLDWRGLAEALGSLREASGEPGQRRSQLALDIVARRLPAAAAAALAPAPVQGLACSSRSPRLGSRGDEARRAAASSYSRRPTCRLRSLLRAITRVAAGCKPSHHAAGIRPESSAKFSHLSAPCRPPERAVRPSTATTRQPRSACSGASRPTSTVRAHLTTRLACPRLPRSHAAAACRSQVHGASAEAATAVSSVRRRAACCRRHHRCSDAARRR